MRTVALSDLSLWVVPQNGYRFGDEASREDERLAVLERAFDPGSQSTLLQAGVQPGR